MTKMHPLITKAFESNGFNISDLSTAGNIITHTPTSERFLTRIATGSDLAQMKGEAQGLIAMSMTSKKLAPRLIGFEISENGDEGAMISDYWDLAGSGKSAPETQRELARKIAKMHTPPHINEDDPTQAMKQNRSNLSEEGEKEGYRYTGKYGFGVPTHCGISELDNTWEESWEVFYRDRRLRDVVDKIDDSEINREWLKMKEKYVSSPRSLYKGSSHNRAIPLLLRNIEPAPRPIICHGDLWSGNAGVDKQSAEPVIWDPACYWGHNESDLGVMHMFGGMSSFRCRLELTKGGFTKDFFDEYHKIHPRSSPYYEERQTLYELWHHLNVSRG
jgi:protein-ribulosamine 3-kinase